jgi:hypothetical protein
MLVLVLVLALALVLVLPPPPPALLLLPPPLLLLLLLLLLMMAALMLLPLLLLLRPTMWAGAFATLTLCVGARGCMFVQVLFSPAFALNHPDPSNPADPARPNCCIRRTRPLRLTPNAQRAWLWN